jgi:hypothetical protein
MPPHQWVLNGLQGFMRDGQLLEKSEIDKMFVLFIHLDRIFTDITHNEADTSHALWCKVDTTVAAR